VRTLNTSTNYDGWQRGTRLDGRDAVQVAVQQRVAGADNADEAGDDDERGFLLSRDDGRGRRRRRRRLLVVAVNGGTGSKVGGATLGGA
jgi:hypothetical protein